MVNIVDPDQLRFIIVLKMLAIEYIRFSIFFLLLTFNYDKDILLKTLLNFTVTCI